MATKPMSDKKRKEVLQAIADGMSHRQVARKCGVSVGMVSNVRNGKPNADDPRPFIVADPMVRSDAVQFILKHKKGFTDELLAKRLFTTPQNARAVIEYLAHHNGINVVPRAGQWELLDVLPQAKPLTLKAQKGKPFIFGLISDTHLCNKFERLDVLELAYDEFAARKITTVLHAGNMIDGECKWNRYEINAHGIDDQCLYAADHLPQRSGIKTLFVSADCHEGWYIQSTGLNVGWYMENRMRVLGGRSDVVHIGHLENDILIKQEYGETRMRIMHPGGGSAYALSYPSQKMVEAFQGGQKPHLLIMGHFHKYDTCYPREVTTIQCGCLQDQSSFMRKRKLPAHVGFCIVTIHSRADGTLGHVGVEWFPYYDAQYHRKLEEYHL